MTEEVAVELGTNPAPIGESSVIAEIPAEPAPAPEDKPKVDPVQKRIDKLTREKYQARAEAEATRRELERLHAQMQQSPRQTSKDGGEPRLDQFDNFDAYIAAKASYIADQRLAEKLSEREQREQERRQQEQGAKTAETWSKRLADVRKEVPDYDDVIESADVVITREMGQAIMDSDIGPKVALYLARNPEEAERLAGLPETSVARAIGRIEAKIEAEALVKTQSAAPKPPTPVSGRGIANDGPSDKQPIEDWMKARNKQLGRK